MYFQNFPAIYYEYEIGGKKVLRTVTDITQNIRVVSSILDSITLYDEYDIMDGETPEIISNKIYGSPLYHWIIMIANQRFNYLEDWPMTTDQLETYIKNKYGDQMYATRYYVNSNGHIINEPTPIANIIEINTQALVNGVLTASLGFQPDSDIFREVFTSQFGTYMLGDVNLTGGSRPLTAADAVDLSKHFDGIIYLPYVELFLIPKIKSDPVKYSKYINVISASPQVSISISNYDYEQQLNESKRRIKIISPNLLNKILVQFKDLI